mmetsp:Transcript_68295/g.107579  ORF Transcript_68295/g.107579 Transcript_68295/m.107579 type:complete len:129 (-) Transcript_68295:1633-2019(-)
MSVGTASLLVLEVCGGTGGTASELLQRRAEDPAVEHCRGGIGGDGPDDGAGDEVARLLGEAMQGDSAMLFVEALPGTRGGTPSISAPPIPTSSTSRSKLRLAIPTVGISRKSSCEPGITSVSGACCCL